MRLRDLTVRTRPFAFTYGVVTGLAALTAALALPADSLDVSLGHFWWIALGSIAVIVSLFVRTGLWTATGAYAGVFWCFHFGLISVLASGLVGPTEISLWDQLWVLGPFGADAALLALMGLVAFASGAALVSGSAVSSVDGNRLDEQNGAHLHGTAGSVLVFTAVLLWGGIVVSTSGRAGFFASYSEYLDATSDFSALLALIWLALGCGLVMSVTGNPGWLRTSALAVFGCLALVALPLGLRGEIMFPSIAALVAAARCGRVLSPRRACAFVAMLLVVIPAVREVRATGLQGLSDTVLDLHVFDAFVEMGGSLHPVEKVMRWRAEGEALEMGSSYWAPIERAAARILPGVSVVAAEDDMRIMNVLVTDRVGPIGFSPVAEAYRNFGAVGVVIVLGILGAALAAIDRIADRRLAVLAIATLYVPLLINVRNSFVSVPLQCVLGILFVGGLGVMRHLSGSTRCKPYAGKPYARSTYVRSEI